MGCVNSALKNCGPKHNEQSDLRTTWLTNLHHCFSVVSEKKSMVGQGVKLRSIWQLSHILQFLLSRSIHRNWVWVNYHWFHMYTLRYSIFSLCGISFLGLFCVMRRQVMYKFLSMCHNNKINIKGVLLIKMYVPVSSPCPGLQFCESENKKGVYHSVKLLCSSITHF